MKFNLTDNISLGFELYFEVGMILVTFIVLLVTIFLAYKRLKHSARFYVVALLNLISFCALIVFISDIRIKTEDELSAILLTYGTSQHQIDSLIVNENTKLFVLSSVMPLSKMPWQSSVDLSRLKNNLVIEHAAEMLLYYPDINQLNVYGDGLLPQQWQMINALTGTLNVSKKGNSIKNIKIDFYPSKDRIGPVDLTWPKQLVQGEPFYITGIFKTGFADKERIFNISLSDINDEIVDELLIKNNEKFYLSAAVKNQGLFTYQLKVFDDEQQLSVAEPVVFSVTSAEQIKVAIKQSSASFESKHLKNWLAEQGEEVLILTQVSKDKYIKQTINLSEEKEAKHNKSIDLNALKSKNFKKELTESWLKIFDLLYMDGRALLALSEKEINELDTAIKLGLGLIIIVDDDLLALSEHPLSNSVLAKFLTHQILPKSAQSGQTLNTIPRWLHGEGKSILPYKNAQLPEMDGKVLIKGSEGQPLWTVHSHGLGHIALSLIDSSYTWMTSNGKSHYSHYWQYIISQISRQKQQSGWQNAAKHTIYFHGQAQNLCTQLNEKDSGNINVAEVNLLSSVVTNSAYCGDYFSNSNGWYAFDLSKKENNIKQKETNTSLRKENTLETHSMFFYEQHNWLTWQQQLKHKASYKAANKPAKAMEPVYVPINKLNIWWLLFITLSLLWYERKIF